MNPASPLHLGDEVAIVGPDILAGTFYCGQKMKITMQWASKNGPAYSDDDKPWFPAGSLRKVEEFQKGDHVEVIGPTIYGVRFRDPITFRIDQIRRDGAYSEVGLSSWFPASSLRKVRVVDEDKLQIGDWVEVIGPHCAWFIARKDDPTIFQISRIPTANAFQGTGGRPAYPASSLRKLTPDETPMQDRRYERLERDAGNAISKIHNRLSAIESKLADISPKDRQFSPGETVGEAFQGHLDKINEALEPLAEEIRKDPDFLSKILDERLQEIQAFSWSSGLWTIDISCGNMHLLNSGRDGGKLGEWAKRMMQDA